MSKQKTFTAAGLIELLREAPPETPIFIERGRGVVNVRVEHIIEEHSPDGHRIEGVGTGCFRIFLDDQEPLKLPA